VVTFTVLSYVKIRNHNLRSKLTLATGLLLTQIFMGWFMIYTKLNPLVVAGHLATGIAFFGILLVILLSLHHEMKQV
jgi:cytochrome c oxidase assembly protein subunit 15